MIRSVAAIAVTGRLYSHLRETNYYMNSETMNASAYAKVLTKLGMRFPKELAPILQGCGRPYDFTDEPGAIKLLHDILQRCESSSLDRKYSEQLANIFSKENGVANGIGMVNASFEQHCRALERALNEVN